MTDGIDIQDLAFSIGSFRMSELNLSIGKGEYFVLTGPNGAGKSLLMQLICGLLRPSEGSIVIDGETVDDQPPWQRLIGYVPQDGVLFPNRTVKGNIVFGLEVRGVSGNDQKEALDRVLHLLQIDHLLERQPEGLSGGERQKVSLARALVIKPRVLLLDEPVSAIDESARDVLCRELRRIQQELGITTLHVSHNESETRMVADRVGYLETGVLRWTRPAEDRP